MLFHLEIDNIASGDFTSLGFLKLGSAISRHGGGVIWHCREQLSR